MLTVGKEYVFDYQKIEFRSNENSTKSFDIVVRILIPIDYDYVYPDDPYVLKYKIMGVGDYKYIRYYDKPTTRGKSKWKLINKLDCFMKIQDLPSAVDCSLNTFDEPSKRKWFVHEHLGFSDKLYMKLDPIDWKKYPLMMEDNDITLLYRIACDIVQNTYKKERKFEFLKEKVGDCFLRNYPYKISDEILEEYHVNYLRDLMKLW